MITDQMIEDAADAYIALRVARVGNPRQGHEVWRLVRDEYVTQARHLRAHIEQATPPAESHTGGLAALDD